MSTLLYSERKNWSEETAQLKREQRRVSFAIVLVAMAIGPGVFVVDRLAETVAWRSFLFEALSLCLYAAVAVWYGLRRDLRRAWRVSLLVYLASLAIMGSVDYITKRGLSVELLDSARATDPILLAGGLMLLFVPLLGGIAWRYPDMQRMRLGLFQRLPHLDRYVLIGLGASLAIGVHFWLTTKVAGLNLTVKPWPYMFWQFCYELGPQSLTEELFMRGVVFNTLYFERGWSFWLAALAAAGLELLSLLVKQNYSADLLVLAGAIFYTLVTSIVSAGLFRWSRSIVPGYVNNVGFSLVSMFR